MTKLLDTGRARVLILRPSHPGSGLENVMPTSAPSSTLEKLLYTRQDAAYVLSISIRSLDYLVANKQLVVRRIGSRVLIPMGELRRLSREDHPFGLAMTGMKADTVLPLDCG